MREPMPSPRRSALLAVVPLLAPAACTPAPAVAPTPAPAPPPASSAAPSAGITVAAAFERLCDGPAAIPLEIAGSRHFVTLPLSGSKGQGTFRFHVDTGGNTPGLMILKSVADSIGIASEDALPRKIHLGDHDVALPEGARWVLLDDTSEEAKKRPTSEQAIRKGFSAGQIGAGFLSRFVVCIDPAKGRLGLGDPAAIAIDDASSPGVPVMMLSGGENHALYPFVQIILHDGDQFAGGYGVLLDTGATTSMLDDNKIRYQKGHVAGWPMATGAAGDADMIGGAFSEAMLRAECVSITAPKAKFPDRPEIEAGPVTFVSRPTGTWGKMFGDLPYTMGSHGAIANDVLNHFRLLLDYKRERLWLQPSGRAPDRSASMKRVGLALRFGADGCPEIRQVTDTNAPETIAAVHPGDVLLAVGALDACHAWHHEIQAELAGEAGQKKKLKIRRGGATIDVEVPVADLLPGP
jgi:hypothetical protein